MPPAKGFPPERSPNIVLKWEEVKKVPKEDSPEKLLWIDISMEATLAAHPTHGITWKTELTT